MRLQAFSRRIIPEFAVPVAPDPVDFRELSGSPKFPGNPHDHSPCSSTPAGPGTRYGTRGQRTRHGPRTKAKRGLPTIADFGAQSHGFWSRCLRLVVMVSHHCTQDSLPAAGPSFAGRDSNPQGFYERFLSISTRPPLPSFLGASFVLALFYHRDLPASHSLATDHCSRATACVLWLRFRRPGSGTDDSTSSRDEPCVDSGLASFCTFSGVFTPEGRLCRSQAPR